MSLTTALRLRVFRYGLVVLGVACQSAALAPCAARAATAPSTAVLLAPIDRLIRGIDDASPAGISQAYVFAPTIVDEFAPFRWSGGAAAVRWFRGFAADAGEAHLSHIRVTRHAPSYSSVAGGRAWLVIPTDFEYVVGGKAQRESAAWTFVLVSGRNGWRIEDSTWAKTAGAP